jgi:hypothetical protein
MDWEKFASGRLAAVACGTPWNAALFHEEQFEEILRPKTVKPSLLDVVCFPGFEFA